MSSTTSSKGPGIGTSPRAASQRSGRGMRLSVAAIRTARNVRLRLLGAANLPYQTQVAKPYKEPRGSFPVGRLAGPKSRFSYGTVGRGLSLFRSRWPQPDYAGEHSVS